MTTKLASAYPQKHSFLEMFTRDVSLEDCVLDLIDNSIDGLVRTRHIDISASLLSEADAPPVELRAELPRIDVNYSERQFEIKDTCGGIPRDHALNDVFNFGHGPDSMGGVLSVYGVGLKRAIFKIGHRFEMKSRTVENGFDVDLDVLKWSEKDDTLDDWRIPISFTSPAASAPKAGTTIKITKLRSEVIMRIGDGTFQERLRSVISQTYGLFITRYVTVTLNGIEIEPFQLPLAASDEVNPGHDVVEDDGVKIELVASLAQRTNQQWKAEPAGWYVLCNGRIVVAADKTELTGWGFGGFPQFHDGKFRGFVGVAFFTAKNPLLLPWTTTKRGLNRESPVYQSARNRMRGIARPIITFLDGMYKREIPEERIEREIADQVKPVTLASIAAKPSTGFTVKPSKRAPKTTVRIQFDAEKADVERIRKHLRKFGWGANRVGQYTFRYYLDNECPE